MTQNDPLSLLRPVLGLGVTTFVVGFAGYLLVAVSGPADTAPGTSVELAAAMDMVVARNGSEG